jgi:hypothetical protein
VAVAQVAPSVVGKKGKITWDAVTTNEDGTPCTDLASYTVVLTAQGVTNPDATGAVLASATVTQPTTEAVILAMVPKPAPGKYAAWAKATDLAGNDSSVWAGPVPFEFDGTSPSVPKNPRAVAK